VRLNRRDAVKAIAAMACPGMSLGGAADTAFAEVAMQTWRHATSHPDSPVALLLELVRYATLAPNGHNTQPWAFRLHTDAIDILPDPARRTPVVDPDDHHLWASLGCATENLVHAAAAYGRHVEVSVTPFGVRIALLAAPAKRSALFDAIPKRQSTRAEYDGQALANGELRLLEIAAADSSVQMNLLTDRASIKRVQEYVVAGNSVQMADRAFVAELKSWIRFNERDAAVLRDGLYSGASGSQPLPEWLGSLAFDLFFTTSAENEKYAKQITSSTGVAVFAASRDDATGWVAAGRACERFLLQAAALDIRTAFINQPVEVVALRKSFAAELGFGQRRPDLVVRFGRGPRMPPSLRRPVDAVLVA
jgi:nitroreductase